MTRWREARAEFVNALNRAQPGGVPSRVIALNRVDAEALLAGPQTLRDIADEMDRLVKRVGARIDDPEEVRRAHAEWEGRQDTEGSP